LIPFVKAHACGNDFLIVDAKVVGETEQRTLAIRLCARHTGVGADGVEFLEWTGERKGRVRLFNIDGSIAEISGNGTRCVAAWMAREKQAVAGDVFETETDAGMRECRIVEATGSHFEIAAGMGVPVVSRRSVTLASGLAIEGAAVSMGNPHFVIFVEDKNFNVVGMAWESVGREICFHSDFPQQTNVEFVRVVGRDEIEIRVFERGVGPTTSSGTGTCASAAAAIAMRGLNSNLLVWARGGAQHVSWAGESSPAAMTLTLPAEMTLTGPAELIATGEAF
jgi:diaminopimelate epimerase